ncbi:hypothetical protein CTAYLR_006131 [Chrysophaeum taylorii]|uniref:S-formylglutathione hydrolase n=1 Tax=Chrysophaeum taylorii TaxID=2483200 RepID=A0AAD7UPZ0_9STRA|nr:hypothetical protein CTAYLR_006131 [Chrysophaeum taylorii]
MSTTTFEVLEEHKAFGGRLVRFKHLSEACGHMVAYVYVPPREAGCPALYVLGGLTASDANCATKLATAQQAAAQHGVVLVFPDTSPREGPDDEHPLLGRGASYYVDATREPWSSHYGMFSYVTDELPRLIEATFHTSGRSICGHSMGGHGALVAFLRKSNLYASCSAFAPVSNPSAIPPPAPAWRAFSAYLGGGTVDDSPDAPWREIWRSYDACELIKAYDGRPLQILVDQGAADPKIHVLGARRLVDAAKLNDKVTLEYREQAGYDHDLATFVATFVADHVAYHASRHQK